MIKATTGKRIGAFFLDLLIVAIIGGIITTLLTTPEYAEKESALMNALMNGQITQEAYETEYALLQQQDPNGLIKLIFTFVLNLGYYVIIPLFYDKQTIGRKVTHILVVRKDGKMPGFKELVIREGIGQAIISSLFMIIAFLAPSISVVTELIDTIIGFVLIIGFFMMAFGEDKDTLYDKLSKTRVILEGSFGRVEKTQEENNIEQANPEDIIDL